MIQLVLILEIFGLQVDFNGWHSASWSLRWHQAQTAARSSCARRECRNLTLEVSWHAHAHSRYGSTQCQAGPESSE